MSAIVAAHVTDAALLDHALALGTPALLVPVELVSTVQARGRTALVRGEVPAGVHARGVPDADIVLVHTPEALRAALARDSHAVVGVDIAALVGAAVASFAPYVGVATPALLPARTYGRDPLVLLSGMLGDATVWDDVASGLQDLLAPQAIRIDLDDSVVELADSVLAQAPPRFVLCGHSLGGIVALAVVRRAPERVIGLVLVASSARGPNDAQQQAWATLRERVENGEFTAIAAELSTATLGAARRDDAQLVARNERMAHTVGADGLLRQLAAQSTRTDNVPLLQDIDVPVLVVSGGQDEICRPSLQSEIAEHCPSAELVTVDASGHMLPLEQPDALVTAIRRWYGAHWPADDEEQAVPAFSSLPTG